MSIVQSLITLILLVFLVSGDFKNKNLSDFEEKILVEDYLQEFYLIKHEMIDNGQHKKSNNKLFGLVDKIIDELENHNKLDNSKIDLIEFFNRINSIKTMAEKPQTIKLEDVINLQNGKLTLIEEFYVAKHIVLLGFWHNWSCNMEFETPKVYTIRDTMNLTENRTYKFPLRIEYNNLNYSYYILTNTLQDDDPNYVKLEIPAAQTEPLKYKYEIVAANKITNEFMHFQDSIIVYALKDYD